MAGVVGIDRSIDRLHRRSIDRYQCRPTLPVTPLPRRRNLNLNLNLTLTPDLLDGTGCRQTTRTRRGASINAPSEGYQRSTYRPAPSSRSSARRATAMDVYCDYFTMLPPRTDSVTDFDAVDRVTRLGISRVRSCWVFSCEITSDRSLKTPHTTQATDSAGFDIRHPDL